MYDSDLYDEIDYEGDLSIDPNALDKEWLRQSSLMGKYCRLSVELRRQTDSAKETLDVVRAGLDREIRKHPEKYELEKVTDTSVGATILVQESYTEANGKYLQAKYEQEMVQNAVRAIEHKKDSLEALVRLLGMSYFSAPKSPLDINRDWERESTTKSFNRRIGEKLNKKRERTK